MSAAVTGLVRTLLPRNTLTIAAYTAVGLLQWLYVKLVALAQPPEEFGRFVAVSFLGLIVVAPLVTLQGGISRQVAGLALRGRDGAVSAYLRGLLRHALLPVGLLAVVLGALSGTITDLLHLGSSASLLWLIGIVVVQLPLQLALGTLAGRERLRGLVGVLLLDVVLRCAAALMLPDLIRSTPGALALHAGSLLIATAVSVVAIHGDLTPPSGEGAPPGPPVVLPEFLVGCTLLFAVAFQDALLVRVILGGVSAARYGAAVTLGRLVLVLPLPMIPVLVPEVVRRRAELRDPRPVLAFQLALLGFPCAAAVIAGGLAPALVGGTLLDPGKYGDLGILVPLALATASFHAATFLTLHFLLASGRRGVVYLLAASTVIGPVLVLTAPAEASAILTRMLLLAAGLSVATMLLAILPPRRVES
jgi:hypothetical protein